MLRVDHLLESMEISKSLQQEIFVAQHKLQSAILEHQIYVGRLKDDPDNPDIHGEMQRIQLYILSLGRCQKQIVQRLRKEVELNNANGSKVSIPSLLGLNNNNHITNNNETKHETAANGFETNLSKEDYEEEVVRNDDVHHSPAQNNHCSKVRSSSVETISGEDDVVEMSMDENSNEKQEEAQKESNIESVEMLNFLSSLGLITKSRCLELQNKRVERKRRSTANPQFVYSMLEQPSKRKRHSYLQSGNAPHTRQTTARMNGPSPPPNKTQPTKSTSPPAQTKSLIPIQKSTGRPNILRNADSKVFVNKSKIEDNQTRSSVPSAKSVQSIGSKAVHIPGLPSSLTIERIGNDSVVCICCRNPGSLTVCKNCSSNYHVSCHTRSPAPYKICPRCAFTLDEGEDIDKDEDIKSQVEGENKLLRYRKDEKLVTTAHASGASGKTREDSEVYKTTGGFHKVNTTQKKHILSNALGINQLPASTFLIPIASNNSSASNVEQSEGGKFTSVIDSEQRQDIVSHNSHVLGQHSRSGITNIQTEDEMSHSYQLSGTTVQPEKHQSYLIVKKIPEPVGGCDQPVDSETEDQNCSAVLNYQLPTNCGTTLQTGLHSFVTQSLFYGRNIRKKQTSRAVPLHRVTVSKLSNSLLAVSNDYQLDRATLNGRKPWAKLTRGKLCVNQSTRLATDNLLPFNSDAENSGNEQLQQQRPKSAGSTEKTAKLDSRGKHESRASTIIHSLFPSHNKPYTITNRSRESRGFGPNDRDYPLLRQQLCRAEYELEPREQSDRKPAAPQLQRRALTRFFEHVKLEEAHISAPLRTKLAHQDEVGDDEIIREGALSQQYDDGDAVAEAPLLTSCDLDRDSLVIRFPWIAHDTVSRNSNDDNNVTTNRSAVRHSSDASSALTHPADFDDYEIARLNAQSPSCMVTIRRSVECENDRSTTDDLSSDTYHAKRQSDDGTAATLSIARSNLLELRDEVSVPDDKADTERQDLPSGRRSRSRSISSSSSSSSSSGHSDTPAQAMNNTNDLSDEYEILAIGIVSPRKREKQLERHESAMTRESNRSDATTG